MVAKYGDEFEVFPMHPEDYEPVDPVKELKQMRPDLDPIVIDLSEDEYLERNL